MGVWDAFPASLSSCPLGAGVQGCSCYFANVNKNGVKPLLLSALLLYACRVACKYALISRFKGVFSAVCVFGVGLFVLGALRGLWGFCTREWLGGLKACGVFASIFAFLLLLLSLFQLPLLVLLSCLVCSCVLVGVVSFSLSDKTKKERICFALFLYLVLVSLF